MNIKINEYSIVWIYYGWYELCILDNLLCEKVGSFVVEISGGLVKGENERVGVVEMLEEGNSDDDAGYHFLAHARLSLHVHSLSLFVDEIYRVFHALSFTFPAHHRITLPLPLTLQLSSYLDPVATFFIHFLPLYILYLVFICIYCINISIISTSSSLFDY